MMSHPDEADMTAGVPSAPPNDGGKMLLTERILTAVEPVARRARAFAGFFAAAGGLSIVSALIITMAVYLPFEPFAAWKGLAFVCTMVLLCLPGAALLAFRFGLAQLMAVPQRLSTATAGVATTARETHDVVRSDAGGVTRLLLFIRALAGVRSYLLEGRDVLVSGSALVRVANPIVLVAVLVSLLLSGLLLLVAVIVGAVVLF